MSNLQNITSYGNTLAWGTHVHFNFVFCLKLLIYYLLIASVVVLKGVLLLIIYSPSCCPRYPCHSFFSQKEIKVFDENIPGFFLHIMDFSGNQTA